MGRTRTIAILVTAIAVAIVSAVPAFAQYPPPGPPGPPTDRPTGPPSEPPGKPGDRPPGQAKKSASCGTQPDGTQFIISCAATGFEPGSTVLYEFFVLGQLLTKGVTTADANSQAAASTAVECGSITGFRGVFTGVDENGEPLELSATVDDERLRCSALSPGVLGLATTGRDALWLLALGLLLLAAGGLAVERSRRRRVSRTA